ncbi:MAG: hypothetical protein ACRDPT_11250 [Streptomycetales bacterium]
MSQDDTGSEWVRSGIGRSTPDSITVFGLGLADEPSILGRKPRRSGRG